jgi:hypothetical protein
MASGHESKTNLILKQIASGIDELSFDGTVSVASYQASDVEDHVTFADSTLVGLVESTGLNIWLVKRLQEVGDTLVILYALQSNNPAHTTYADAWADRATLTYQPPEGLLIP